MQSPAENVTYSEAPSEVVHNTSTPRCSSTQAPLDGVTTLPRHKRSSSSFRMAYFSNAMRSHSDGSLSASVVPFPLENTAQKTEKGVDDRGQKAKVVAASRGSHRVSKRDSDDITSRRSEDKQQIGTKTSDTFLDASIQLLHLQDEARQRVRQLWVSVQRLRQENQLSNTGVDQLYSELAAIMKSLSAEKLDGAKHVKSGHLLLLQEPTTMVPGGNGSTSALGTGSAGMKAFFGTKPTVQRVWCTLSEEQSKLEIVPIREPAGSGGGSLFGVGPSSEGTSLGGAMGRFGLPTTTSLLGMISDAFQEGPTTRIIRLQGCQVRKLPVRSSRPNSSTFASTDGKVDNSSTTSTQDSRRFQVLVPCTTRVATPTTGDATDQGLGHSAHVSVSYESVILEVPPSLPGYGGEDDANAETQADDWVRVLDRVCMFQLYRLEHALREAQDVDRYREMLARYFPVCVPLSWLRNRVDHGDGSSGGSISRQVQLAQQRRSSRNLSMVQIIKDLERDKVMIGDQLFSAGSKISSTITGEDGDDLEQDSVSEMVKYVVTRVLEFEKRSLRQRKTMSPAGASPPLPKPPTSSANRFSRNSEARALSFVERVLRGSSRTQSGGDIYDAISFFCQQQSITICPVSQDARPVQMQLVSDVSSGVFQVEVQVCMRFKVIELTPTSPKDTMSTIMAAAELVTGTSSTVHRDHDGLQEWAVLEGTLSRQFTLGHLSTPGTVTIDYVREENASAPHEA